MAKPRPAPVPAPETCPSCGAEVPRGARACPQCGSDENTGWSERARYDGLDLPDDEFDYQDFVDREFGGKPDRGVRRGWVWWIAIGLLILAFLGWIL